MYAFVIMITGYPSIDNAVNAIKEGAYDYLVKPVPGGTTFEIYLPCTEEKDCPQPEMPDKGPETEAVEPLPASENPQFLSGTRGRMRRWFWNALIGKSGEKDRIATPGRVAEIPAPNAGAKRAGMILMVDDDESVLSIGIEMIRHMVYILLPPLR